MASPSTHPLSFGRPRRPYKRPLYYDSAHNSQEFPDLQLQTQPPHDLNNKPPAFAPYGDFGPASASGGNKQQKRKRTIPGTQDKHRKWFAANLQHPYPTEDQKQDLMRQTGLRMGKLIQESYTGGQESSAHRGTIFPSTTRTAEAFAGSKSIDLGAPSPRTGYNRPPPMLTSNRTIIRPPLLLEPPPSLPRIPDLTKVQHVQELCLAPIRNQPPSRTAIILPRVPGL
ncbi:PTH12 [Fusarium beomiforme]|uniref:PTH12 n=1 Tax=Fusarium beomiforme TaxID=44412 RepID=A0A9P5APM7_9HYPO|nr:PTH12 [Fusarium beomiforme]